jgi:hypothetical protein
MVSNYLRIWWQKNSRPAFTSLVLWSQSYVVSFPSIYHEFYGGNDSVSAHSFFHILKCSNRMLPFQADIKKICLSSNMDDFPSSKLPFLEDFPATFEDGPPTSGPSEVRMSFLRAGWSLGDKGPKASTWILGTMTRWFSQRNLQTARKFSSCHRWNTGYFI